MVNEHLVREIIDAKTAYETALLEHVGAQNAKTKLTNIMLNGAGDIIEVMLNYNALQDKVRDLEEMVDALETSLGEADDKIKALENGNVPKKKKSAETD